MMGRDRDMTAEQRRTLISIRRAGVAVNRVALQMNKVWRRFMEVVLRRSDLDVQRRPHSVKTAC